MMLNRLRSLKAAVFRPARRVEKVFQRDFHCLAREFAAFISEFPVSVQPPGVAGLSRGAQQLRQPHQIVGGGVQREHPADPCGASVARLAEAGGRLDPADTSSIRLRFFWLTP
jgi:hypothetical protein